MKSSAKSNIIISITLGLVISLSLFIITNNNPIEKNNNTSSEHSDDRNLDYKNLQISAISGEIHIVGNSGWAAFKAAGNCTGNGIFSDPYVIEDLVIDGRFSRSPILIENSNVHFKIINCTVYNSGAEFPHTAGIVLNHVTNANLIDNNCSNNAVGISLHFSHNNTITGNIANNNQYKGIYVWKSDNNLFSRNILRFNMEFGLNLDSNCYNNNISGNTLNDNFYYGLLIYYYCNYNIISRNIANNNDRIGISLQNCDNNIVLDNTMNKNTYYGITIRYSNNNLISGNTLNNNMDTGLHLFYCQESYISANDVNYNGLHGISLRSVNSSVIIRNNATNNNNDGIWLLSCDNNNITENRVNNNNRGMNLIGCNYNKISHNEFIGNTLCWVQEGGEGNIFEYNTCIVSDNIIPGYNLGLLLGIFSVVLIILSKRLKKF